MNVIFRVDASIEMGIGHVMRCLTLADALRDDGAQCHFVSCEHPGNMIDQIISRGHQVFSLPLRQTDQSLVPAQTEPRQSAYTDWLGSDWFTDARQTTDSIGSLSVDWLVIDHYAIDECWEKKLRHHCKKIMVIDDLADRTHDCDLLLDQTYGRSETDYKHRTPPACKILTGAKYALLRPEFAALREWSLQRRKEYRLEHILISMGGVDKNNATRKVLQAIKGCHLPENCRITVVMGENSPWLETVRDYAKTLPWSVEVKANVADMAQLMANSDLSIGAAGSTSWERCCLGVPTLMVVLAENQKFIADALHAGGAALRLGSVFDSCLPENIKEALLTLSDSCETLHKMSSYAAAVTAGRGACLIVTKLFEKG